MHLHRAEVAIHQAHADHHGEGEQSVKVIGDGVDEQGVGAAAITLYDAGHSGGPGADRGNDADGSGRGVDDVGELCAGDLVAVSHRAHYVAHGEAVEVVIHEDQAAEADRGKLCRFAGLDRPERPFAVGDRAAGLEGQRADDAEQDREDHDAHVPAVAEHGYETVIHHGMHGADRIPVCNEKRAYENAGKKGGMYFFGDECKGDGDDRRNQGPEGTDKRIAGFPFLCGKGRRCNEGESHDKHEYQCFLFGGEMSHEVCLLIIIIVSGYRGARTRIPHTLRKLHSTGNYY